MPFIARTRTLSALPALFLCVTTLHAGQVPYAATVIHANAEVRCKPSTDPKLYPTNRLPQGARVLVLEERSDGWLGIQPPPGSFSWVNATQVERIVPTQANWVVKTDSVPVLIGGDIVQARPTVEGVRLARGTQLRVLGQEVRDVDGSVWLPIDSPAGEIRYLRADAVRAEPNVATQPSPTPVASVADPAKTTSAFTVNRTTSKDPALSIPAQTTPIAPTLAANATPWQKAEYYERLGQWADAIRIYEQLAKDLQPSRPDWADFANKRAAYLRNGGKAPVNWSSTQAMSDVRSSTFYPTVPPAAPAAPQARLLPPADPNATTTQQTASWNATQPNTQTVTKTGTLVRSGYYHSGDAQYRLQTSDDARFMTYAVAGQGIDLERYVDHAVELTGTWSYRGDLHGYYMVVSSIR
jgi:hypothetical protein